MSYTLEVFANKWNFTKLADKVSFPSRSTWKCGCRNRKALQRSCRLQAVNWKSLPGKSMEEVTAGAPAGGQPTLLHGCNHGCFSPVWIISTGRISSVWAWAQVRLQTALWTFSPPTHADFLIQNGVLVSPAPCSALNLSPNSFSKRLHLLGCCRPASNNRQRTFVDLRGSSRFYWALMSWCRSRIIKC